MVKVYSDDDFNAVCEQKKKVTYLFIGVSAVYLAICIACLEDLISYPAQINLLIPSSFVFLIISSLSISNFSSL